MLNDLTGVLVRGVTETLKCMNFLILFIAAIGLEYSGKRDFRLIAIVGVVLYLSITITIDYLNKNNKGKGIKYVIAIIIETIIAILILKNIPWQYKPYCIIYFLAIIFYATIHYDREFYEADSFLKKHAVSSLIIFDYFIAISSLKYFEVAKIYFLCYMVMSIIYIIQLNIMEQYRDISANLVNENKNIKRFNVIAIFITISSCLIFITDFFKGIFDMAYHLIQKLLYTFLILFEPIMYRIAKIITLSYVEKHRMDEEASKQNNKEKLLEEMMKNKEAQKNFVYNNPTVSIVIKVILIIVFVTLICALIYIIYRKFMMNSALKDCSIDSLDSEERSFVFKKDKVQKEKKNKENLKDLHVIRRIYIDVIKILKTRGVEYKNSYTPNEYNSLIENTSFKSKNISELVNIYNSLRYGNKIISKEDINKAYKIKENL